MIYLSDLKEIETNIFKVNSIHYMPFDLENGLNETRENLEKHGVFIDFLPSNEEHQGKKEILYFNKEKNEAFYKYEDIPKSEEDIQKEKINKLENENVEFKLALAEQQESTFKEITELKLALAELIESNIK